MKVLLVQPPHYYGTNSRPPSSFPLGIAYIARALKNAGHVVETFDIYAHQFSHSEVRHRISNLNREFDALCVSALSTQYAYVKWLINELKLRFDRPLILGNALATFNMEVVFKHTKADICVISEGEETIVELLDNLGNLSAVKGIAYRESGKIIVNPRREYISDLDSINFPERDMFAMDIYLKHTCLWSNPEIRTIDIISARGCPYDCNFCSRTFSGIRLRSVANIIEEIEELRSKYDFKGIKFNDELTLINKQRTYELCAYLKKSKLSWICQGRVNVVDRDLLKVMKDSGCKALGFGVESGSNKILANMNKGITAEQAVAAINATKEAGIEPIIQMMFGYPGEDDRSLEETVNFFKKVRSPTMQFSMTTALPGTRLYQDARNNNLINNEDQYLEKLDWGYYADREVLINFTNFADSELTRKRKEIEDNINRYYRNYITARPWILCGILLKRIKSYYLRYGLFKTSKKMMGLASYLRKDSWMI